MYCWARSHDVNTRKLYCASFKIIGETGICMMKVYNYHPASTGLSVTSDIIDFNT